jgi:hypothetical protein
MWQNRAKIQLSAEEWNTIKAAVEHGVPIPTDASKIVLLGYDYALRKQSRQLAKERSEIQKRKDSAIAASAAFHAAHKNASHTDSRRHRSHGSRVDNLEHSDRRNLSRNLDSSFLSVDEQGNIIPKTPEAALVAAQTYLYTTWQHQHIYNSVASVWTCVLSSIIYSVLIISQSVVRYGTLKNHIVRQKTTPT